MNIRDHLTEIEAQIYEIYQETGSQRKTAERVGRVKSTVAEALKRAKRKLQSKAYSPEYELYRPVPDNLKLCGLSDMRTNEEGKPIWYKFSEDKEKTLRFMEETAEALAKSIPAQAPINPPKLSNSKLCTLYTLTDCHVGMYAWEREGGSNWDLDIAEETLIGCFRAMMDGAPNSEACVINQLGDWLHFDGLEAITPTSKHNLDSDGRFGKVVETSIRILRKIINMALEKHKSVHFVVAEGNHDLASSVWLRKMFMALYDNEPRLVVNDSEMPYYVYQHGDVMLGFHHGHLKKNESLPLLFAAQFSQMWGATTKRYGHTGHRHHTDIREHSGMLIHQHPTLAARDSHASRGGWIAERQATAIIYHETHGQVATVTVTPEMIR